MATQEYVQHHELELVLAHTEARIVDRIDAASWRLVGLILPIYALVIGTIVAVVLFGLNILSRIP